MKLTKKQTIISSIVAFIIAITGYGGVQILGAQQSSLNSFDALTSKTVITTGSPVKLLDMDTQRQYAIITNISDTTIYLFVTTTPLVVGTGTTTPYEKIATSSISSLNGIPILTTDSYEFDTRNMAYGDIWASSTVASKSILVNYK